VLTALVTSLWWILVTVIVPATEGGWKSGEVGAWIFVFAVLTAPVLVLAGIEAARDWNP
jgi:hypothetical protein